MMGLSVSIAALVLYEKLAPLLNHLEGLGAVPADSAVVHAERLSAHPGRTVTRTPRAAVSP
jgi:hypothetical protein